MPLAVEHAGNGLMRGILTGDVAAPTGNTEILIDACLHHVIEVQVCQSVTLGTARPTNSSMRLMLFVHPGREPGRHFLDDTEAIDHRSGADLHIAARQAP